MEALFPRLNPILSKFPSDAFAADGFAFIPDPHTEKGKSKASDFEAYEELVALLSDWHLLAYLDTCGIFDAGDMKLIARIAAKKEVADVKKLLESPAWKTLATIAKEHAGKAC